MNIEPDIDYKNTPYVALLSYIGGLLSTIRFCSSGTGGTGLSSLGEPRPFFVSGPLQNDLHLKGIIRHGVLPPEHRHRDGIPRAEVLQDGGAGVQCVHRLVVHVGDDVPLPDALGPDIRPQALTGETDTTHSPRGIS